MSNQKIFVNLFELLKPALVVSMENGFFVLFNTTSVIKVFYLLLDGQNLVSLTCIFGFRHYLGKIIEVIMFGSFLTSFEVVLQLDHWLK